MIYYGLYNKELDVYLDHPAIGVWSTNDLKEATSMLEACRFYIKTLDLGNTDYESKFVIVNLDTKEEI